MRNSYSIFSNVSRSISCVRLNPVIVVSRSIVVLLSIPTIDPIRNPPFIIKFFWNSDFSSLVFFQGFFSLHLIGLSISQVTFQKERFSLIDSLITYLITLLITLLITAYKKTRIFGTFRANRYDCFR